MQSLEKMKDILFCPGVDCKNIFVKAKRKKNCRRSECEECGLKICGQCGEQYTREHERMKCGPYKRWKSQNDSETKVMDRYKKENKASVKKCPGCKRSVERNYGCPDMKCTNCRTHWCWNCAKTQCICE